jgi:2-polyprenyl-6-methoxyphenol hydroxylase-like FAD-dependent oxidoreductase
MSRSPHTRVLVAGGGPVGMLLAAELGWYGVDTVVLEAADATGDLPKAGTLHARTAQSLARRGYLAVDPGPAETPATAATTEMFHFAGIPALAITAPAGEPRSVLKRAQADLEREFEARARERGVTVLRGHTVTAVRQEPDRVEVAALGPDGPRTFSADYLVGADGARSTVRTQVGFAADTSPATVSAMMGQVRFLEPDLMPQGWHRTPRGWTVARVGPDGQGLIRTLDCSGPHPDRNAPLTLDELRRETSRLVGHDVPMSEPRSLTRFGDFTRLVRGFREDRVLLVGDAAHVHFPVGGQGLSSGLLDALNLGWKLAHTLRGTAGEDLLDSYDAERRPVAQRIIDNTRAQLVLMHPAPALDPLRNLVTEVLALEQGSRHIGDMISGQETVHPPRSARPSPREGTFLPNLRLSTDAGDTDVSTLLRDGRPLLLLFGEAGAGYAAQARGWAHVLRTVPVTVPPPRQTQAQTQTQAQAQARWQAQDIAAVLVRPDGYLAWASDGDALAETLPLWFGAPRWSSEPSRKAF